MTGSTSCTSHLADFFSRFAVGSCRFSAFLWGFFNGVRKIFSISLHPNKLMLLKLTKNGLDWSLARCSWRGFTFQIFLFLNQIYFLNQFAPSVYVYLIRNTKIQQGNNPAPTPLKKTFLSGLICVPPRCDFTSV